MQGRPPKGTLFLTCLSSSANSPRAGSRARLGTAPVPGPKMLRKVKVGTPMSGGRVRPRKRTNRRTQGRRTPFRPLFGNQPHATGEKQNCFTVADTPDLKTVL